MDHGEHRQRRRGFGILPRLASHRIEVAKPPPTGAYGIWTADANGLPLHYKPHGVPNPASSDAVDIYFGVDPDRTPVPKDQSDLQASIEQVLGAARFLYIRNSGPPEPPFRLFYTRLFRLAQLGLEGQAAPEVAKSALDRVSSDLVDAESGRVKNEHLAKLGAYAAILSVSFLGMYVFLSALPPAPLLAALSIDQLFAKSFMMLWVGCFPGVWLSYAIRTTTFTLRDLVVTDSDRLLPLTRLAFAGLLTMTLGLILALGFADVKVGGIALAGFTSNPMEALLFGLVCGVSELLLPSVVSQRVGGVFSKI